MSLAVVYTTVGGMLLHEGRGGVETFYVPDPLGSVVQTKDASGTVTSETEYGPYGEVQSSTGTNPSPWGYVGTLGYLKDNSDRLYVRARHYRPATTRWMTVDPLWPDESAYGYVSLRPTSLTDPSGLISHTECLFCAKNAAGPADKGAKQFCKAAGIGGNPGRHDVCNAMLHCLWACATAQACGGGPSGKYCSKFATDYREEQPKRGKPNPADEACMDRYNNRIGINCSDGDCYSCCSAHVRAGNVQVLQPPPKTGKSGRWRPAKDDCTRNPKTPLPKICWSSD
ncbi:RHS repeat-associated core domain-containing protein [bacterium]|nr:MAG: RHS repeat-associated core domain-containing protein [bacterium]